MKEKNLYCPMRYARKTFMPLEYPFAFERAEMQQSMHWMPKNISLTNDLAEYNNLTESQRNVITNVLRFFTQIEVEVANCYVQYYLPCFNCPEIRMMLLSFASMEVVHIFAYSHLITSLNLPDSEFSEFLKHKEMLDKYEYMQHFEMGDETSIALNMAIVSAGIEGCMLFSSFAMLMYFGAKHGIMRGIYQIINYSRRDETLHCLSIIELFHEYLKLYRDKINMSKLYLDIVANLKYIVELEHNFIDLVMRDYEFPDLTKQDLKNYIKHICDRRLCQLGFDPIYDVLDNPLKWVDEATEAFERVDFFQVKSTSYANQFDATKINWTKITDIFKNTN